MSTIGELDSPMLPDAQGMTAMMQHLRREAAAGRQQRRNQVLGTSAEGFRRIAAELRAVAERGTVKVVGSDEAVKAYGKFKRTERLL